jgi:hypothetical protein
MWIMGFANQQGETALQEENDQEGLNGVNCRNSLRVNCSTIELGTRGIWEALDWVPKPTMLCQAKHGCAYGQIRGGTLNSHAGGWQVEIARRARQFVGTEVRSSQAA